MLVGQTLDGRYQIIKRLGGGGFGDTYLAKDLRKPRNSQCVVKHLKPIPNPKAYATAQRLFYNEAEKLDELGHECDRIPSLYAYFEESGQFYLVQEFIDGTDLSQELPSKKKCSEDYVIKLLQEILEVLAVVHQHKIIHRDIKPQNLIRRRKDGKMILIDFGAVKQVRTAVLNSSGQASLTVGIGTVGYMPPEQAHGSPKFCSDVYAVGAIGIEALTGIVPDNIPKDPKTGEFVWRNQARVSSRLADIIDKMVRVYFPQRYQTAMAALQALQTLSPAPTSPSPSPLPTGGKTLPVAPGTPPHPAPSSQVNRRGVLQWLGFTGTGFASALLLSWWLNRDTEPETTIPVEPTDEPEPEPTPEPVEPEPIPEPEPEPTNRLQTFNFDVITVDSRGRETNQTRGSAQHDSIDMGNGVTLDMVLIPGGRFMMGSPASEEGRDGDEGPQHEVTVPEFFMGRYTVTQAQWQAVMGNNPSEFKGANRPVENVSWDDAVEFCEKLSQMMGETYRLPSEAEWEYACRAGTTTPFHFGETLTTDLANYDGNSTYADGTEGVYREETVPVDEFPYPNAFGLYQMHGNVWEWCADPWHENYNGAPNDGTIWSSSDESLNNVRLLRGGSWLLNPWDCRSAARFRSPRDDRGNDVGFRVVSSPSRTP